VLNTVIAPEEYFKYQRLERTLECEAHWSLLRVKPKDIQPVFCAINHGRCEDRTICDRNVNNIIKRGVVKVKRCERPSDFEFSGHYLRVGAAQDLLIRGSDLAAINYPRTQRRLLIKQCPNHYKFQQFRLFGKEIQKYALGHKQIFFYLKLY